MKLRSFTTLTHIGFAFGALLILGTLFTFLPYRLPTPENLSPWVYLVAAALALIALVRMGIARRRIWLYIPILLLAIFGFLEETSYGVESGAVQPQYSDTFHVEIYDVHNLIPIIEQIFTHDLEKMDWNFGMSAQFLRADGLLLIGLVLFAIAVSWNSKRQTPPQAAKRTLNVSALFSALVTALAAWWLLSLPADSGNGSLFGYSPIRLGLLVGLLVLGGALPVFAALGGRARLDALAAKITALLTPRRTRLAVGLLFMLVLLAGLVYQTRAPLETFTGRIAILERLNPLIVWTTAMAVFFLLALPAWRGRLQASLRSLAARVRSFFTNNPAYIYVIFCVLFVGFAQLMDQDRISLAQYLSFPNPWGEEWNYWLEETLEMTGAFELVIAAFFFPTRKTE